MVAGAGHFLFIDPLSDISRFPHDEIRFNASPGASSELSGTRRHGAGASNLFAGNVGNVTAAGSDALEPTTPLYVRVFAVNPCGTSAPTPDLNLVAGGVSVLHPGRPDDVPVRRAIRGEADAAASNPAFVTRRFNDGGGFNFTSAAGGDQLFLRIVDMKNCALPSEPS